MQKSEFLRVSDVAPLLGVGSARAYQLVAAGVIPAVRIAGVIRIPRDAWESWLEEQNGRAEAERRERAEGHTGVSR